MKKIIAVSLCIVMIISMMPFTFAVSAEENGLQSEVYVSANDSIVSAMESVKDGGTIHINGTIVVPADFSFNKNVTIVGGTLEFSTSAVNFEANTAFEGVTLKFATECKLYANGNVLVIGEGCATTGTVSVYGGGRSNNVGDTNITLLAGTYKAVYGGCDEGNVHGNTRVVVGGNASVYYDYNALNQIYGGGYGGMVTGNTYVELKGNANKATFPTDFSETNHDSKVHYVFGGGFNCDIGGSTTVKVSENAKTHYVYGGMNADPTYFDEKHHPNPIVNGSNVIMEGGRVYGIYGASANIDQGSSVNVLMLGGTVSQVMGASSGANLTGKVDVKLLGGQVTRRVFGGCYNDWSGDWKSSGYVSGIITLTIGEKNNIKIDLNQSNDNAFSAHSRRSGVANGEETGNVLFTSEIARSDYEGKLSKGQVAGGAAYSSIAVAPKGDANLDGELTSADIEMVFRNIYNAELYSIMVPSMADMDGDGKITNKDLLAIYKSVPVTQG